MLWKMLEERYGMNEAKAVVRYLLEMKYGLSLTDILCEKTHSVDIHTLRKDMERLCEGVPVQYVVGKTLFAGRCFEVSSDVLIPREETAELCRWITEEWKNDTCRILDVGTGSGCIAITLSLDIPGSQVVAWDISEGALSVARKNAEALQTEVVFCRQDILDEKAPKETKYDIIVSNPPYICYQERDEVDEHVLNNEPSLALFVPDNDPLLFYRAIMDYAKDVLKDTGMIYFEINPHHVEALQQLGMAMGFTLQEVRQDSFGKLRMLRLQREMTDNHQ
ncbi:MAG: peptide chain release factor N(5)-glutamine methyltransferase [Prevotella sp.]|nr:peptide chain release factor N(5)-glutamine methyltransferase [Prevotella sp.]MBQ9570539.1 peptide chain release factor N(5)-glutamine methyltransferase [Prevotella sp.]